MGDDRMKSYVTLLLSGFVAVFVLSMTAVPAAAQHIQEPEVALPLSNTPSMDHYHPQVSQFSIAQQRAWYAAQQNMYRQEWFNWIGYSPLRPTVNASYMSNGYPRYYVPSRGVITSGGAVRSRYW
jgi:hypothetical protein